MNTEPLQVLTPEEIQPSAALAAKILEQLDRILLGRHELHRMVLAGILSRGHILLEGLPGLGKTELVRAVGRIMQLDFKRIQFTPDLMPSDILGTHILQETDGRSREMVFQPGPVFTNILLADEINRASPKTQSAMLETMQEHSVTLMGMTRKLPVPFFVLASQNPIELEGTYPLPEAQIDRFLFKLVTDSVDADILNEIITTRRHGIPHEPDWTIHAEELESLFATVDRVILPHPVARYISRLVSATHTGNTEATDTVNEYVTYGASPRAAIAIGEAARALALLDGRPTAGFEDVRMAAPAVLNHRILLNYKARFDRVNSFAVIESLLSSLDETGMDLPGNVTLEG
jgi:MoxR-like ATPase